MLKLLDLSDTFLESRFIQSCVGLEGIGAQLAWDEEPESSKPGREILSKRFERIIEDIGFTFSEDWARRTAEIYNNIKHYDRNTPVDARDISNALLENELIFRSWAALKIGVNKSVIIENISSTPSAQTLYEQKLFGIKEI